MRRSLLFNVNAKKIVNFTNSKRYCTTNEEYVTLGKKAKNKFQLGLLLLGGTIFGGFYHFSTKYDNVEAVQNQIENAIKNVKDNLEESLEKDVEWKNAYGKIFNLPEDSDPLHVITPIESSPNWSINEKAIKKHLKVIGFEKKDFIKIINEKKANNEKLDVSEIIDELIADYKAKGTDCVVEKYNRFVKVKSHETTVTNVTPQVETFLPGFFYCHKKYEKTDVIIGKQEEGGCQITTKLNVDEPKIMSFWREEEFIHYFNVLLCSSIASFSTFVAFKTRPKRKEIFLEPIRKTEKFKKLFRAGVGTIGKASIIAAPLLGLQMYLTPTYYSLKWKYNNDGFAEIVHPNVSHFENNQTVNICNSKFSFLPENQAECVTQSIILSDVDNFALNSFYPVSEKFPITFYLVMPYLGLLFYYPLLILPSSCLGAALLALSI